MVGGSPALAWWHKSHPIRCQATAEKCPRGLPDVLNLTHSTRLPVHGCVRHEILVGLFFTVRDELVIPVHVGRPGLAGEALGVVPVLPAFRADTTSVEGVPDAPAGRTAHPMVRRTWLPFTLGTEDPDVSHARMAHSVLLVIIRTPGRRPARTEPTKAINEIIEWRIDQGLSPRSTC